MIVHWSDLILVIKLSSMSIVSFNSTINILNSLSFVISIVAVLRLIKKGVYKTIDSHTQHTKKYRYGLLDYFYPS